MLERESSQAEVIEDYPHRRILVRVTGSDTRVLLAIVDDQLDRIHRSFPRLKYELAYRDPIRAFMRRLGRGKCVLMVLSKAYLESESCMFELTEIDESGDIRDRIFPIVLEDAGICKAKARLQYVKHWEREREKADLDAEMKQVGGENLEGIRETIDLYAKIRATAARIMDILADMNALTPEQHQGSKFDDLFGRVKQRLSD